MGLMLQKIKVDNNYAVVIDNWYGEKEYNKVFNECKFFKDYMEDPEQSGSATSIDGRILKKNKAVFVNDIFREFNDSYIGKNSYKLYQQELFDTLYNIDSTYHYLRDCNSHNCIVSYYEESDYYHAHHDIAMITMLTWLYEEPKAFSGGNLILRDKKDNIVSEIECIANRSVLFPSYIRHEVNAIHMDKKDLDQKKGRFTVSQFFHMNVR
jgi:Rps23 Pro-64 3,4-dihydroxylase Tpa1-like proline 4-hydroxylase